MAVTAAQYRGRLEAYMPFVLADILHGPRTIAEATDLV